MASEEMSFDNVDDGLMPAHRWANNQYKFIVELKRNLYRNGYVGLLLQFYGKNQILFTIYLAWAYPS